MAYAPYLREPTVCKNCGAVIGFVKNRNGRWFPVDFVYNPSDPDGDYYRTGMGAHGNFTPWHKCETLNMPAEDSTKVTGLILTRYATYNEILKDAVTTPDEVRARIHTFYNSGKFYAERVMARRFMSVRDLVRMTDDVIDEIELEAGASCE